MKNVENKVIIEEQDEIKVEVFDEIESEIEEQNEKIKRSNTTAKVKSKDPDYPPPEFEIKTTE